MMKTLWTKGIPEGEIKKAIIIEYKQSPTMRDRLCQILAERRESAYDAIVKDANYESPNWAYKQADHVGYMRALKEISDILTEK